MRSHSSSVFSISPQLFAGTQLAVQFSAVKKNVRALYLFTAALALLGLIGAARPASAQTTLAPQTRLCDPTYDDCREPVLQYIRQETQEIAMGFWLMSDARYSNELVLAWQRGVKIRLLMDPRCGDTHSACMAQNDQLAAAGIPMRNRTASDILHWKVIIFASQGQVEFAGANYAPFEMVPDTPYVNFTDEIVMFTKEPSIVHSFMTKFDDLWTSTTEFANYANVTAPLTRSFATFPIDPDLNFPPDDSYRTRAINAYSQEPLEINVLMFRITDESYTNGLVNALARNVPVRLITDEQEYRNPARLFDSYNVDRLWYAGVQVRLDGHQGINHEKAILLRGRGMSIFGSSNWTAASTDTQREHNMFTTQPWVFEWLKAQFERKWNNSTGHQETKPFVPLPPDVPTYNSPANGAINVATTGTRLLFAAGLWAHLYDIYFGTTPNPPLLVPEIRLGPSVSATDYRAYTLPTLQPGTRYYWKIVSKTMAHVPAEGTVWSFTTAGTASTNVPPTVSLTGPANGATFTAPANITVAANAADSDGTISKVDFFSGNTLIGTATAAPFSITWTNVAQGNYSLTAVATDSGNATATSSPVSISVGAVPLPSGWSATDIGAVGAAGGTSFSNGTFSVTGAGADVWGTADALQYAYRSMAGDGSIVARVTSIQAVNAWTKAGVMIRNSIAASSAQGFMLVASSAIKGVPFQRRTTDGNISVSTPGSQSTAPRWVKLVRSGNLITGYESPDGVTWTVVGSDTIALGSTALIGLGVSSHVAGTLATATFDNVTVTTAAPPNAPPAVSLTSPAAGATFTAPATITVGASATDDGSVASVQFFAGATPIGTVTSAPYQFTWSNVPAGSYSLTAIATDNQGATTRSNAVSITVNAPPPPNAPPTVSVTSPAAGATFTAPATINVTAAASDDGTIANVRFFAGTTLLGTVTTAPYQVTWSNVAAGTYSLTAVATDNAGATTTSTAVSVTVNDAPPPSDLPAGWQHADIGAVPIAGAATASNGTFTVTGSGADVWDTADAFHYAYTTLSGDGTIIARVTGIQQGISTWVKAGVMIRNSTSASAAHGFMLVAASATKGVPFQRRTSDGNISASTPGSQSTAPRWVKLQRNGNLFSGYESADGVNWTLVGTDTITMGTNVLVGLAVTSHNTTASATCTFDNVTIR